MTEEEKLMQYVREAAERGELSAEDLKALCEYASSLLEAHGAEGSGNEWGLSQKLYRKRMAQPFAMQV